MTKTLEQGREEVARLVEYYATNQADLCAPGVKEAHVRQVLIDPFFEALGWDVRNAGRHAPQYREVIPEDSLDVEGQQKAPDYTFRVGTLAKFYVEAKKCGVNLADDPAPAYQLRRYGWSAKVPFSLLTDFEELAVYDCTQRPRDTDKASRGRIQYFRCEEYVERWAELWDVFSRAAVWSGKYDQYAASKRKRGTSAVDDEFLKEIEGWREELARNIALRNADLSVEELNAAVQLTIDRIVFLRMAEDRGLEPERQLLKLSEGDDVYDRFMRKLCRKADDKYNSGLFHFHKEADVADAPDRLTPGLSIDDKVLRPILQGLYFEYGSPYHFGVLPVEMLGTVYERFLGKVIRLTAGHQAKVEEKPEVRKAGGVYYTPSYIVEAIVRQTVGPAVENRSPAQLAGRNGRPPLRILDLACGSGSFLLGAYQFLLDYCLNWYAEHSPAEHARAVYRDPRTGAWRLTIGEKKRLLTTHLFGVDLDAQAVEVTKLSLLLKALEGETDASLMLQIQLFEKHRALPNLADNIQCGNSLIGPAYFSGKLLPETDEMRRVNPFAWERAFPATLQNGGFDCIIGNPPYVRIQTLKESAPLEVEAYKELYQVAREGNYDLYVVFVERGLQLLRTGGRLGFICPNKFFNAKYGAPLRKLIAEGRHLSHVVHFGDQQVFAGATTYTCLLFLSQAPVKDCRVSRVRDLTAWRKDGACTQGTIAASALSGAEWNFVVGEGAALWERLQQKGQPLGEAADLFVGLQTSADDVYVVPLKAKIEKALTKPFLLTGDLQPYVTPQASARLVFPYSLAAGKPDPYSLRELQEKFPKGYAYLHSHRDVLARRNRRKLPRTAWHLYVYPKNLVKFLAAKLIIQVTAKRPTVMLDEQGLYMTGGGSGPFYGIRPRATGLTLKCLLGILNSRLFGWFVRQQSTHLRGGYFKFSKQYIESAPIVVPPPAVRARLERLVEARIQCQARLAEAGDAQQRAIYERQIAATDAQIERLVYDLYELSPDEIAVVEGADSERS